MIKKIYFGNDHAAYEIKDQIIAHLKQKGYEIIDEGAQVELGSVNYSPYALKVANDVVNDAKNDSLGILLCGTGIGMNMAASKVKGARVALIYNESSAKLAKEHNNANVITIGARENSLEQIIKMIDDFLESKFMGERHQKRLDIITEYEKNQK
ncbi:RpiB/LacA/LacB family sugar-phosphate isomerase [Ureaplasma urealyticum]|uniref:Ribose 5-phosphate isomerase B n=2 Tax=Ureaplasma urealyticum TaxID=2130 RepID=A0AAP9AC07_UREUR|nr:RpiB/LacA/LacB family sugar-phosphate isomerase [Ureaplasma urealyticum]EDX54107.1 sugar-phosphate isomerase, RpiB/LacA/LacB family [Ureaplasma urealyticum serovar 9 str. ATCC 33175]EDT49869.1 ribose-5-phosphate isomerase B [Ureaplasma urealyticum serovar 13 str. ATCC 33698]EDU06332.1 ribose-5-phosphate isomerase B [Ureaplasma urealyticum serovar 5 str. ATCC 27817]EDU56702.1 ribose-5-phosphate isomerase B [Ureaplasma urealyticum serovar 7 str. ATCC 27819]EDU67128.1 ribose-5-phosphate isomer